MSVLWASRLEEYFSPYAVAETCAWMIVILALGAFWIWYILDPEKT